MFIRYKINNCYSVSIFNWYSQIIQHTNDVSQYDFIFHELYEYQSEQIQNPIVKLWQLLTKRMICGLHFWVEYPILIWVRLLRSICHIGAGKFCSVLFYIFFKS